MGTRARAAAERRRSIFVLGEQFGNIFVGVQPAFGYEGDPMRLLFEKGFAPTHAFSAFYRWLREDFAADAVLHFGTHGALEFMPGKQAGMSGALLARSPDRRPAELLSLRVQQSVGRHDRQAPLGRDAGQSISRRRSRMRVCTRAWSSSRRRSSSWRGMETRSAQDEARHAPIVQAQAVALDLAEAEPAWEIPRRKSKRCKSACSNSNMR